MARRNAASLVCRAAGGASSMAAETEARTGFAEQPSSLNGPVAAHLHLYRLLRQVGGWAESPRMTSAPLHHIAL